MPDPPPPHATNTTPPLPSNVIRSLLDDAQCIDVDWRCVGCGYNLRTLHVTARCPECDRPVRDSVHLMKLARADLRWLRLMRGGAAALTLGYALVAATVSYWLLSRGAYWFGGFANTLISVLHLIVIMFLLVIVLGVPALILVGTGALTTREPGVTGAADRPRWLGRVLAALCLATSVPGIALGILRGTEIPIIIVIELGVAAMAATAVHAGRLLPRDARPRGHIRGVAVAIGLSAVGVADVLLVRAVMLHWPAGHHTLILILVALHAVVAGLCTWLYAGLWRACNRAMTLRELELESDDD